MSVGFSSPKLTIHIKDGIKFMEKYSERFDVIITDSSDPIGECGYVLLFVISNHILTLEYTL